MVRPRFWTVTTAGSVIIDDPIELSDDLICLSVHFEQGRCGFAESNTIGRI